MTLYELTRKIEFNRRFVDCLIEKDEQTEKDIYAYKEAWDTLSQMTPSKEEGRTITIRKETDERGFHASNCEGDFWEDCLASEVVLEEGVQADMFQQAASILWGITFYGFDPHEGSHRHPDRAQGENPYETLSEGLLQRQYAIQERRSARKKRRNPDYPCWKDLLELPMRMNGPKRKRYARLERQIERYDRMAMVFDLLQRIERGNSGLEMGVFSYLYDTELINEDCYVSRCSAPEERVEYIRDLIMNYTFTRYDRYDRFIVMLLTGREYGVEDARGVAEELVSHLPGIDMNAEFSFIEGKDEGLGDKMSLLVVASREK